MNNIKQSVGLSLQQIKTNDYSWLRLLCLLACVPSAGALLLKVYGVMQMDQAIFFILFPCIIFLVSVWLLSSVRPFKNVGVAIALGALAGLMATFAYDVIRVPFYLYGIRIFITINTYGLWIADSSLSSRFTDVIGWTYHYSNGISFGIIYSLFMRGQHWIWAIVYACILETIALASPFKPIFGLSGNWTFMGIAYLGHVAYGLPLGFLVQNWDATVDWLQRISRGVKWVALGIGVFALISPIFIPGNIVRDNQAAIKTLQVDGPRTLNPDFVRIKHGESITVSNPTSVDHTIHVKQTNQQFDLVSNAKETIAFPDEGIFQVFIETKGRPHSSFVVVEPVEKLD